VEAVSLWKQLEGARTQPRGREGRGAVGEGEEVLDVNNVLYVACICQFPSRSGFFSFFRYVFPVKKIHKM
jgi:hypothetical protein